MSLGADKAVLVCPEGYFGDHCMTPCQCESDNFICHPAEGCICKHGFTGEHCDESNILSRVATNEQSAGYGVIVAVVVIMVTCSAIIVLLWLYYKRRVSNLKTEIAHVHYNADPHAFSPGKLR